MSFFLNGVAFLAVLFSSAAFLLFGARFHSSTASRATSSGGTSALQRDFAGTWDIHQTDEPSDPQSPRLSGEGTEVYGPEPGGMPFVEQYHSVVGSREAHETAYFWWDSQSKRLRGLWCASFNGEGCSPFRVWREGDKWIMEGEYVSNSERFAWRENFTKQGPDAFVQTLEIGKPGATTTWKPSSTIHANRRK